jgi:hypothetical protein
LFAFFIRYHLDDQTRKGETGETYTTYEREEICIQNFSWGTGRKKQNVGKFGVDWGIILKCTLKEIDWKTWAGSVWFRTGTCGGLL